MLKKISLFTLLLLFSCNATLTKNKISDDSKSDSVHLVDFKFDKNVEEERI